ncbi:T9SS type A sorting domain-containing protein [Gracilimonas halophila]|uniref:T9SS type A sorting domain-containing protein n=1 Tax=Gracilimonas halophila TaxID=1834464 RepID=A0ABW5JGH4_9BACT
MKLIRAFLPGIILLLLLGTPLFISNNPDVPTLEKQKKTLQDRQRLNKGRADYFFQLLRDPATDDIPKNIRNLELKQAENLPVRPEFAKLGNPQAYNFTEVGPFDVGGRTRALAVDIENPDIVLAGGVSGGVWRSTDGGDNWTLVTDPSEISSVTYLAQDPRSGFTDNWYFVTGEFTGNSANTQGGGAFYYGNGVWKSTDNGVTWTQISSTDQSDNYSFNSSFDYISKVMVSPSTGSIFIASNGVGILRSTDGQNFNVVLGGLGEHSWSDFDIAPNGDIVAVISQETSGTTPTNTPGVYVSTNDGTSWSDVSPAFFPGTYQRSVISLAPSSPNEVYVLTSVNGTPVLSYIDLDNAANNEDRTANLPDYGEPSGEFNLQGGYNMLVKVHPTSPETVITGGTNLYISFDGYTTAQPADPNDMWIGGYSTDNNVSGYSNHHADQHVVFFDPNDPDKVWSGHDGGVSLTSSITTTPVSWVDKNNGYNVTQFYGVSLHRQAGDERIMGGTQDNGTPFFNYSIMGESSSSIDLSSGDGSYSYFADDYAYVSSQNGNVLRLTYLQDGGLDCFFNGCGSTQPMEWTSVEPDDASGQLFIHPFKIDPTFNNTMYYPEADSIWRNTQLDQIPSYENSTMSGWSKIPGVSVGGGMNGYTITTLEVSVDNPSSTLYYAGYNDSGSPKIFKINNANSHNTAEDISIVVASSGSYPHDISVNPTDGNELLVIFSNYNVPSIFHSSDGGSSWSSVEGNLNGDINTPGPSVRTSAIIETTGGPVYYVGTSTGVYSTTDLNGALTTWTREAESMIGKSVVEFMDLRPVDNYLAVGTHGRGLFLGEPGSANSIGESQNTDRPNGFSLNQNYPNPFNPTTSISFSLPTSSRVSLAVFDISGRKVLDLLSNSPMSTGDHTIKFDAGDLASGVYLYRMEVYAENGSTQLTETRRMTLIK